MSTAYPDYEWLPWKFPFVNRNFWDDVENQKKWIIWAGKELKIKELSDWYNVKREDIIKIGGSAIFPYTSLPKLLATVYPKYAWQASKFLRPRSRTERPALVKYLTQLFVNKEQKLLEEFKYSQDIELQIFLPNINLAFELTKKPPKIKKEEHQLKKKTMLCKEKGFSWSFR